MDDRISACLYYALQYLRKEPLAAALHDVRRSEFFSIDELKALQAQRMQAQLLYAIQTVPFYQERYSKYIPDIRRSRSWAEINNLMQSLPPLEKEQVLSSPKQLTSREMEQLRTHPDKTSGSTGTPLVFPCDQEAWAYRHALMIRHMEMFGLRIGQPYSLFFGLHWDKRARRQIKIRDWLLNRVRVSAFDLDKHTFERYYLKVRQHKPVYFLGYPSSVYDFCFLARERGIDLRELKLKAVFLTAEPLLPYQRDLIEKVTGSRCVNQYGSAEGGFNVFECPERNLHIAVETTWLRMREPCEISGEVLVTDMMLRAFPMINYAIGDEMTLLEDTCSCRRAHPLVASIDGRSGEPIYLPNGRRINANLPSYIFKPLAAQKVIQRYRFVQDTENNLNLFLIVSQNFNSDHMRIVEHEVRAAFGEDITFNTKIVDRLENLPNAKHKCYVQLKH